MDLFAPTSKRSADVALPVPPALPDPSLSQPGQVQEQLGHRLGDRGEEVVLGVGHGDVPQHHGGSLPASSRLGED